MLLPVSVVRSRLGGNAVDITVRAGHILSPTWPMVLGLLNTRAVRSGGSVRYSGKECIDEHEYARQYFQLLESRLAEQGLAPFRELHALGLGRRGKLVLGCYCAPGQFCHTDLAAEWLHKRWPRAFCRG